MSKSHRSAAAGGSHADTESTSNRNKPAHTIRYNRLKGTIWRNAGTNGDFYTVTFSRSYQDKDEQWRDVASFNTIDLPLLSKLADDCHSWITWQERRATEQQGGKR